MNFKLINCLIVCFCASSTLVFSAGPATSCFSIADGDFDDDNTWNCDGVAGGDFPFKVTSVVISHAVVLNVNFTGGSKLSGNWTIDLGALLISAAESLKLVGATITINGVLTINDLSINNGAAVVFASTFNITINGNFVNDNNSNNVNVNTTNFTVGGDLTNGNRVVIEGSGSIYADGDITNGTPKGTLFGCSGIDCCDDSGNDDCCLGRGTPC